MRAERFLAGLIGENTPLAAQIVAFNTGLAGQADRGRLTGAGRSLALFMAKTGSSARFSRHLPLLVADAPEEWALSFEQPRHRLALLPTPGLWRLAHYFGLVAFRSEVAGLIAREQVLELRREVGEDGHVFALNRTALLPRPPKPGAAPGEPLPLRIRRCGQEAVAACLKDAHPAVVAALCLKLPEDFAGKFRRTGADAAPGARYEAGQVWPLIKTLVTKEIEPQWAAYFS